jgi:hypothetical protein
MKNRLLAGLLARTLSHSLIPDQHISMLANGDIYSKTSEFLAQGRNGTPNNLSWHCQRGYQINPITYPWASIPKSMEQTHLVPGERGLTLHEQGIPFPFQQEKMARCHTEHQCLPLMEQSRNALPSGFSRLQRGLAREIENHRYFLYFICFSYIFL